ncbi:adenine phosphoribosyltransferase [Aquisalinus flavus]|uniref:Adenine phosphoribosyltransferase n=1 Tax=Aquisalinus flavus TaxID=1526572 RepID=A0A8J2V178_9PROT|nr:adenine phosphoribosyltransferase [Aquisalinus flavus]MBD0427635.1 adenine phosphoribosyltransferase [Aquisalinus flavus]UNE47422.1 adenine phosphoribosyltransferase [Aquisalinus flavus]GGD02560.1 adenine phosphoribosyltransferase [Aquisalinus flavus]
MSLDLSSVIRTIPDYPKPGIMFRDVTTLMGHPQAFSQVIGDLMAGYAGRSIDKVAGMEARGFIFGAPVAERLTAGFVPIRKKGKLPHKVASETYQLEYGEDVLEMHLDAVEPGERVLIIDDLIATGGTAEAAIRLLEKAGAEIIAAAFVIDLPELGGADRIRRMGIEVSSLVSFGGH